MVGRRAGVELGTPWPSRPVRVDRPARRYDCPQGKARGRRAPRGCRGASRHRAHDFAGHRNRLEANTFIDNAPEGGAVIDIQGGTESISIVGNEFVETRGGAPRLAVKKGPETKNIVVEGSRITGLTPDEAGKSDV